MAKIRNLSELCKEIRKNFTSNPQELTNVESLGEGKFKVSYNDMGNKGASILTVVVENGNVLIDEIG